MTGLIAAIPRRPPADPVARIGWRECIGPGGVRWWFGNRDGGRSRKHDRTCRVAGAVLSGRGSLASTPRASDVATRNPM
jgi:hypothetical protein